MLYKAKKQQVAYKKARFKYYKQAQLKLKGK